MANVAIPNSAESRSKEPRAAVKGFANRSPVSSRAKRPATGKSRKSRASGRANKTTKIQGCLDLLERPDGASIEALQRATGWQPHSVRAALTGLRKKGHVIDRTKSPTGTTCYRVAHG